MLDVLGRLVDKSLVENNRTDPSSRYRLLEIVRDYAYEKAEESGELEARRARHLSWYVALAEDAESALEQLDAATWFNRLESELDNLRVALAWSETSGATEMGLRLAGALRWFWDLRGHAREGREHLAGFSPRQDLDASFARASRRSTLLVTWPSTRMTMLPHGPTASRPRCSLASKMRRTKRRMR